MLVGAITVLCKSPTLEGAPAELYRHSVLGYTAIVYCACYIVL